MSLEDRFVLMPMLQQYLVKPCPQIQLGKPAGLMQLIEQLVNDWNWILRLDCKRVQLPKINTEPIGIVLLLNQ